jgi:cytochrome c oxidase subunit 3
MTATTNLQEKKFHPKKFAMWIAIGAIIMMFGGLTSGYIVHQGQGDWEVFPLPTAFYYSTVAIVISSITLHAARINFKKRNLSAYRTLLLITFILGLIFTWLQYLGFSNLADHLKWNNNKAFQHLLVITLVHALHILGGVVALFLITLNSYRKKVKENTDTTTIDITSTYWHFVDILWLYLLVFFLLNR